MNATDRAVAAQASLSAFPVETPGFLRYSVFQGLDELTLFHLSQWREESARDDYVRTVSEAPRLAVDAAVPGIRRDWRELATPYRRFVREPLASSSGILVVVRQPFIRPDADLVRDWIDTVFCALETEGGPPDGLCAASFFVSEAGDVGINLAEWVSAEAHLAALVSSDDGIGDSVEWRAARSHPGLTAQTEFGRYEVVGVVESPRETDV